MLHRRARFVATVIRNIAAIQTINTSPSLSIESTLPSLKGIVTAQSSFKRTIVNWRSLSSISAVEPSHAPAHAHSPVHYTIRIATGAVRGAGTHAVVRMRLIGTEGKSDFFAISTPNGFEKGTNVEYIATVDINIGQLRMVLVELGESDGSVSERSWFLDRVLIEDDNGVAISFPCTQWFGLSPCGSVLAPTYRYLLPESTRTAKWLHVANNPVKIKASGMVIPHPDKIRDDHIRAMNKNGRGLGGEDAYFAVCGKNEVFGMGVADGVHEWRIRGVDPGRFAYYLMDQAYLQIRTGYDDVFRVLNTASRKLEAEGVYGSSTCCILTINKTNGRLNSVMLGDSGFIVVGRREEREELHLVFSSPQQEHEFGCPYQLGRHKRASKTTDAIMDSFQVFPGDTIVMGTDGLFDNVFLPAILQQIEDHRAHGKSPQTLAGQLIDMAYRVSIDKYADSPYSRAYTEALNLSNSGGKPDDITAVVAYVS